MMHKKSSCTGLVGLSLIVISGFLGQVTEAQDAKKKKELKPEPLSLTTLDGVVLECTWFPSDRGKEAVPVILLHDWEGNRGEVHNLGVALQKLGYAAIAPDLRTRSSRFPKQRLLL